MNVNISPIFNKMYQSPELNVLGATTTCISLFNSFFSMLNPTLSAIFYILSIGWLGIQIYYKIKRGGK